ncbi:hypothetical protein TNCV_4465641 [Trichonephila clavipes]|nr:hypothetical protein TNCV_4465641 [Trichonephila clavipes]
MALSPLLQRFHQRRHGLMHSNQSTIDSKLFVCRYHFAGQRRIHRQRDGHDPSAASSAASDIKHVILHHIFNSMAE